MSGRQVQAEAYTEFNGGRVYFCCPGCPLGFKKDVEANVVKGNFQLFQTGQAQQTGCPFSGRPVKEGHVIEIAGVNVGVCCPGCAGKLRKASEADQLAMVFNNKAFGKGFKVGK